MALFRSHSQTPGEKREYLLSGPIPRVITMTAIPAVLDQLVSIVYNTVDTLFMSRLGTSAAAALGVVLSMQVMINALVYCVTIGARGLISRRMGAGDFTAAHTYAASAMALALGLGTGFAAVFLLFLDKSLLLFGATSTMLPFAREYALYLLLGTPIHCAFAGLNAVLLAQGMSGYSAAATLTGSITNLILDPVLMFALKLDAAGAALATVIGYFLSFLIALIPFLLKKSGVLLRPRYISRRFRTYFEIVHNGSATLFRQGCSSTASTLLNRAARPYGDAVVAAITICNRIYLMVRHLVLGFGHGYNPLAGYCFGAKRYDRVKKGFTFTCAVGTGICLACSAVLLLFPDQIIRLFRDDAQVRAAGCTMLRFCAVALPTMAYSTFVNQLYQSLGFSFRATLIACFRQGIFFIPLLYLLHSRLGETGLLMTQAAADLVTFFVTVPFHIVLFRRLSAQTPPPVQPAGRKH